MKLGYCPVLIQILNFSKLLELKMMMLLPPTHHHFHKTMLFFVIFTLCCRNSLVESSYKKQKYSIVWLSQHTHLVEGCLLAAVCGKFSEMKSLSAMLPYSWATPESLWIVWTQSRYEFVTSRHFYLGLQAVFSHKAAQWLQAALSQVFLSVAFFPKTKRVVSMLSENYSLQDVSPSYLLLKATFHHLGKPSCPISHP